MTSFLDQVQWNKDGLVPVITQDAASGRILMLAWANREALSVTIREGRAVYWSRSRSALWRKGEESGNVQKIIDVFLDCDNDTLCYQVEQIGGIACHTGRESCFFQRLEDESWQVNEPVLKDPAAMYGNN
ncbi:MAG: phosphoribosyl-AMP cyclohydrolase [Pseudomonadales bacterium]|nr:phosphoribosyl-AMP cyclohydrolase [Pseudomonadales bacterium]